MKQTHSKTRHSLIKTATRLFLDKGFDNISIEQIATAANVPTETFYNYFPTKESIVFLHREEQLNLFRKMLTEYSRQVPLFEAIRKSCLEFTQIYTLARKELLEQNTIVFASQTLLAHEFQNDLKYEEAIVQAILDKTPMDPMTQFQAKLLAGSIFGVLRAAVREWFESNCTLDLEKLGETAMHLLENGLKGIAFQDQ